MTTRLGGRASVPGARHELKHRLDAAEAEALARRLRRVLPLDAHGGEHGYRVTSLYFDTPYDETLLEKVNGLNRREKFRLRYYGTDVSRMRLERKSKAAGLGFKSRSELTREQAERLVAGDADVLLAVGGEAAAELYLRMRTRLLRPRTVVSYDRLAFSYAPGNVRVTIDTRLRAGRAHDARGPGPRYPRGQVGPLSARRRRRGRPALGPSARLALQVRRLPPPRVAP